MGFFDSVARPTSVLRNAKRSYNSKGVSAKPKKKGIVGKAKEKVKGFASRLKSKIVEKKGVRYRVFRTTDSTGKQHWKWQRIGGLKKTKTTVKARASTLKKRNVKPVTKQKHKRQRAFARAQNLIK